MAQINLLTKRRVDTLGAGFYADGANLYLRVRSTGSRSFVFRYKVNAKVFELGLGPVKNRSLIQARELASKMRSALSNGENPASLLKARKDPAALTFKSYALELIEAKRLGFKNAKHIQQWRNTLEQYAFPEIGEKRPAEITLADMKEILNPLWATKTETATRVRQRIESVIDYAAVHEETDKRNPARWKGNLDKVLQAPHKIMKQKHHAAAPYEDVPTIMRELRKRVSMSAYCLRWIILTAARSGEGRGTRWAEIEEAQRMWKLPESRMKASREHKVPLCDEAIKILQEMKSRKIDGCNLVFPGARGGLLSDSAVGKTLHSVADNITVHGFRSSMRQWGAEVTSFQAAVLELALAHVDPNKVQSAYQRSDLFVKRRELMDVWGRYCTRPENVVELVQLAS